MATIYSTRFIRGTVDLDSLPSYTVPDGYVAVVRQITAYDGDNILDDYIQLVHSDGTILAAYNAPAGEAGNWAQEFRIVVEDGASIGWSVQGTWDVYVGGYLLAL
jgi:hypothetical protein